MLRLNSAWIVVALLATSAASQSALEVGIWATRPCRISLTVQGQSMFDRALQAGEQMPFTALVKESMALTVSDAGAVVMALNGLEAKPLGKPGERVTVRITVANFQDYLISPARAAIPPKQHGAIAGRVLDPSGKPLVEASVWVTRRVTSMDGLPVVGGGAGGQASTDARGNFRVLELPPDEYVVLARRSNRRATGATPATWAQTIFAPTFFPATRDLRAAKPITVALGQEVSGIDITMVSTRGLVVSGQVLDAKQSPVRTPVTLVAFPTLIPEHTMLGVVATPDSSPNQWIASVVSRRDGNFSIGEVPSGTYKLIAAAPWDRGHRQWASMRVTIEKDVSGLKLVIPGTP